MAENWHKRHALMLGSQLPRMLSFANCSTWLIHVCTLRRIPRRLRSWPWFVTKTESGNTEEGPGRGGPGPFFHARLIVPQTAADRVTPGRRSVFEQELIQRH